MRMYFQLMIYFLTHCLVHQVGAQVRAIVIVNLSILHSQHLLFKFQLALS
jgi:hypothetical protein